MIVWVIGCNYLRTDHPWTNYLLGATIILVVASALHYLYWMRTILPEESRKGLFEGELFSRRRADPRFFVSDVPFHVSPRTRRT